MPPGRRSFRPRSPPMRSPLRRLVLLLAAARPAARPRRRAPSSPSRSSAAPARRSRSRSSASKASPRSRSASRASSRADLERSGLFRPVDTGGIAPRPVARRGRARRRVGARAAPTRSSSARCSRSATAASRCATRWSTRCAAATLASTRYVVTPAQFRATAHKIADEIYEKLTGDAGVFSTRIAYIAKQGAALPAHRRGRRRRRPADHRQHRRAAALAALVARRHAPRVRVARAAASRSSTCRTSRPARARAIAAFRGSNSAPAWSPDGRRLAVTLTRDGGSQLFLMNADGSGVRRIMTSPGADTEAWFMPDGRSLLFTSDRGGSPQIYRVGTRRRRGRAPHVRRQLQRVAARAARRQGHGVRAPRRQPLPGRDHGLRDAPDAGADRRAARRIARASRPTASSCSTRTRRRAVVS